MVVVEEEQDEEEGSSKETSPNNTVTPIKSWLRKHIMDTVRPEVNPSNSSSVNSNSSSTVTAQLHMKPVYIIPQVGDGMSVAAAV